MIKKNNSFIPLEKIHPLRSRRSLRGFTLVEVWLVVILLGMFVSLGLPNFRNVYKKLKREREINNIVTFLRYAQELALKDKARLPEVRIKSGENKLILKYMKKENILRQLTVNPEIKISTETPIIIFDGWGNIAIFREEKGAQLLYGRIDATDNSGREYKINIYSTGYINSKPLR